MSKDDILRGKPPEAETPEKMEEMGKWVMEQIKGKGFMLLVYPMDGGPNNYISNSPPEQTWAVLQAVARGIQTASNVKTDKPVLKLVDN